MRCQAKSSNVVELDQWNPSLGPPKAQAKSDTSEDTVVEDLATSGSVQSVQKVSVSKSVSSGAKPAEAKPASPVAQDRSDDSTDTKLVDTSFESAVVKASVSVASDSSAEGSPVKKSKVTHKGTVEDIN